MTTIQKLPFSSKMLYDDDTHTRTQTHGYITCICFYFFFLYMHLCICNYVLSNPECWFPRDQFSYYLFNLFTGLTHHWHLLNTSYPDSSMYVTDVQQKGIYSLNQAPSIKGHLYNLNLHDELVILQEIHKDDVREN